MSRTLSIGAVVTVLLLAPAAIAQPQTVSLSIELHPGDAFFYSATASSEVVINMLGTRQSTRTQQAFHVAHRVLEVDPQGTALVEVVLEDVQTVEGNPSDAPADSPTLMRVLPNGTVTEHLYGELPFGEVPTDYLIPLPDHPIAPGDSWKREGALERFGVTAQAKTVFTLVDVIGVGDAQVARIRDQTTGTVSSANLGPMPSNVHVQIHGTIRGTGDAEWLINPGRPLRSSESMTIDMQMEVTGEGSTLKSQFTVNVSASSTPLYERDLPQVVVPGEYLIIPAQGIGASTLSMPVEDLTSRLGQPESQDGGATSRVSLLEWPGGLGGFVDPTDSTRLLGLKIADRQYRTEKGIGVGSTMGATVLAYGLGPKSVDLSAAAVGTRLLVYDDLGIAFGISTSTETGHAPLGAVDWVAVFPPGSAARIFPSF